MWAVVTSEAANAVLHSSGSETLEEGKFALACYVSIVHTVSTADRKKPTVSMCVAQIIYNLNLTLF